MSVKFCKKSYFPKEVWKHFIYLEMEYDPVLNCNRQNGDPAPEPANRFRPLYKRQTKNRKRKISQASLSLDDGLPKRADRFPEVAERLSIQNVREINLSHDNPRFITTRKYSLKPKFNKWKLQGRFQATNIATGSSATMHPEQILEHEFFSTCPQKNYFKLKERNSKEYPIKSGETSWLVPVSGISALPENDNEQDVDRLAKALERMRLKNKRKRRAKWRV